MEKNSPEIKMHTAGDGLQRSQHNSTGEGNLLRKLQLKLKQLDTHIRKKKVLSLSTSVY